MDRFFILKLELYIPIHYSYKKFSDVPEGQISYSCSHKVFVFTFDFFLGKIKSKASCGN